MSHYPVDINYFLVPAISGRMELDLSDLDVEGEVPAQLDGAFFRMQPDPYFPRTTDEDVYFNGDGVVGRFDFSNGKVGFRQRYALTDKLKLEKKAGRALFGRYRNPLTDDPSVKGAIRGTANMGFIDGHAEQKDPTKLYKLEGSTWRSTKNVMWSPKDPEIDPQ